MDDDFDRKWDRDCECEPSYPTRHRPLPLVATGTLKARLGIEPISEGEAALHASTSALLTRHIDRCPKCGAPVHAAESNDEGVCVGCLGDEAVRL